MDPLDQIKVTQPTASGSRLAQSEEHAFALGKAEIQLQENAQNLGFLGKMFGANCHAPTNIAGFAVVSGIVGILCTIFFVDEQAISDNLIKTFGGIVLACLGYLFGTKSKDS